MMNCKQAAELICQSLDRPLTLLERLSLRFHVFMCRHCKGFEAQNRALLDLFEQRFRQSESAQQAALPKLPDHACEKLKHRLREAAKSASDSQ